MDAKLWCLGQNSVNKLRLGEKKSSSLAFGLWRQPKIRELSTLLVLIKFSKMKAANVQLVRHCQMQIWETTHLGLNDE